VAAAAEAGLRAARSETLTVLLHPHLHPALQCGAALMPECPVGRQAVVCSITGSAFTTCTQLPATQPGLLRHVSAQQAHYERMVQRSPHLLPSLPLPLCELVPFSSASSNARRSSLPDVDGDAGSGSVMAIKASRSEWGSDSEQVLSHALIRRLLLW
jgi:hypothetical protein